MEIGTHLPTFSLEDQKGNWFNSDEFVHKKNFVIFFYPKDFTSVCTKEACMFRDLKAEFDALDTIILGVNNQSPKSHEKFAEKFNLNFPLLTDKKGVLSKRFNLKKKFFFLYPRETYVFNKEGFLVEKIVDFKDVDVHINKSLEVLKKL